MFEEYRGFKIYIEEDGEYYKYKIEGETFVGSDYGFLTQKKCLYIAEMVVDALLDYV